MPSNVTRPASELFQPTRFRTVYGARPSEKFKISLTSVLFNFFSFSDHQSVRSSTKTKCARRSKKRNFPAAVRSWLEISTIRRIWSGRSIIRISEYKNEPPKADKSVPEEIENVKNIFSFCQVWLNLLIHCFSSFVFVIRFWFGVKLDFCNCFFSLRTKSCSFLLFTRNPSEKSPMKWVERRNAGFGLFTDRSE